MQKRQNAFSKKNLFSTMKNVVPSLLQRQCCDVISATVGLASGPIVSYVHTKQQIEQRV
jgi:hypothetical protein